MFWRSTLGGLTDGTQGISLTRFRRRYLLPYVPAPICLRLTVRFVQLPIVPQLREVKVPMMTVPPFDNKPDVLSPLSATRSFVEVWFIVLLSMHADG